MYNTLFVNSFALLGERLNSITHSRSIPGALLLAMESAFRENDLFTIPMQLNAIRAIASNMLVKEKLDEWLKEYSPLIKESDEQVLIVMAGNLPLVGFHDYLSLLASGKKGLIKLSSKEPYLLPQIHNMLVEIDPYWQERVTFIKSLPDYAERVIATGNDSTAYYFRKRYHYSKLLVRGSKSSLAVLYGDESDEQLGELAKDLFLYFGLGCRNVSTLFVPEGYDLQKLIFVLKNHSELLKGSESYKNSYRYQKALATMQGDSFFDGGDFIIKIGAGFPSPIGVVALQYYNSVEHVESWLKENKRKIQCVVNYREWPHSVPVGQSQSPSLTDYADGVNSLAFLFENSYLCTNNQLHGIQV